MKFSALRPLCFASALLASSCVLSAAGQITDHGVAAPVGQAGWSGIHATADAQGHRQLLITLWTGTADEDQRRLLVVDVETGESKLIDPPAPLASHGNLGSFGTFLSSKNRYYNVLQVGRTVWFMEYDVASGEWTAIEQGPTHQGRGFYFANTFTEADDGTIYAGLLPTGELLAFDPETKKLTDHGRFGNWERRIDPVLATDSAGWLYGVILYQQSDVLAWKPGQTQPESIIPEGDKRPVAGVRVYRAANGKVYAKYNDQKDWYELFEGKLTKVATAEPEIALRREGWGQPLAFPDGSSYKNINVPSKSVVIVEKDGTERTLTFDYDSAGVQTYSVEIGPDGKVYGSTGIPLRFFRYDPQTGEMDNWGLAGNGGHVNDIAVQGGKIFGAVYGTGSLFVFDPERPWEDLPIAQASNPRELYRNQDLLGRPFAMLAHPDGKHVLMGGNPYRSKVGGGLLIHNMEKGSNMLLTPEALVADQGVASLAALPNGDLVIGTTVAPGTGGTRSAKAPYVLLFDWEGRKVRGKIEVPGVLIADLVTIGEHEVAGITHGDAPRLFVVDPEKGEIVRSTVLSGFGTMAIAQGARILSVGPDGNIYVLFRHKIVRVNPADLSAVSVADVPAKIETGSAWLGDRLYFTSGARLMSWQLQE